MANQVILNGKVKTKVVDTSSNETYIPLEGELVVTKTQDAYSLKVGDGEHDYDECPEIAGGAPAVEPIIFESDNLQLIGNETDLEYYNNRIVEYGKDENEEIYKYSVLIYNGDIISGFDSFYETYPWVDIYLDYPGAFITVPTKLFITNGIEQRKVLYTGPYPMQTTEYEILGLHPIVEYHYQEFTYFDDDEQSNVPCSTTTGLTFGLTSSYLDPVGSDYKGVARITKIILHN